MHSVPTAGLSRMASTGFLEGCPGPAAPPYPSLERGLAPHVGPGALRETPPGMAEGWGWGTASSPLRLGRVYPEMSLWGLPGFCLATSEIAQSCCGERSGASPGFWTTLPFEVFIILKCLLWSSLRA